MRHFILFFLLFSTICSAKKVGAIIAIGDYPENSGWDDLSSANDIPLIKNTLKNQAFLEENLYVLADKNATKLGILNFLKSIKLKISKKDILVVHFSGHGQQIFDKNGDESDGKDEAIIPYDALQEYSESYKGENHLRDDDLGDIFIEYRNILGKDGQLLVLFDSCHSGTATRGGKVRGGSKVFAPKNWSPESSIPDEGEGMFERTKLESEAAPFIFISGSSANEANTEYSGGTGSLSYAFSKAMNELGKDFTYRQLFAKIAAQMNVICPNQTPTIEGDIDYKLFKGEIKEQQPYYEVATIENEFKLKIPAGKIQGIYDGTTFVVVPAGIEKSSEDKILAKGTVMENRLNSSTVELDTGLKSLNEKEYWLFLESKTYGDFNVQLYLDENIEAEIRNAISTFIIKNNLGKIVSESEKSDLILSEENSYIKLFITNGFIEIDKIRESNVNNSFQKFESTIFNYAQGNYLKGLDLKDEDYKFEFRMIPIEYDKPNRQINKILDPTEVYGVGEIPKIIPGKDFAIFEIKNLSEKDIFFSIVEINTKGELFNALPNNQCNMSSNERKIPAGKTVLLRDCVFEYFPPYEKLMLKGFATNQSIDFKNTIDNRGKRTRSSTNPLDRFLASTYVKTRGANTVESDVEGYTYEMVYEIVKEE